MASSMPAAKGGLNFRRLWTDLAEPEWENTYSILRAKAEGRRRFQQLTAVSVIYAITVTDPAGFTAAFDKLGGKLPPRFRDFPRGMSIWGNLLPREHDGWHALRYIGSRTVARQADWKPLTAMRSSKEYS